MDIPFGPFAPDAGDPAPGICLVADGVLPQQLGYGPMQGLSVPSSAVALGGAPRGLYSPVKADGTWLVFGFEADSLNQMSATGTWSEIEGSLNCPDGYNFSATPFGAYFLYTNTTDGLRAYNIESGGSPAAVDDAGDPEFIFTATSSQVVALNCKNDAGTRDNRLMRVCAFNDHTNWASRGAGQQSFESGGAVICGAPLTQTSAAVFQERAIRLIEFGQFTGNAYFRTNLVSDGLGSVGAKSMVPFNGAIYWLATDGFCRLSPGGGIERIGAGRVDNWFLSRIDQSKMNLVEGAVDPFNKMIWWRWQATGDTDIVFSRMLGYSWQWDRWVTATVTTTALTRLATPGYKLGDLTTLYGTLDAVPGVLGSRLFQGGQPVFAALNGDYKIAYFSGSNLAATLTTSRQINPVTGMLQWATPHTDADATIELGTADTPQDDVSWKTAASIGRAGRVPLRGRGMNIAFRTKVAAAADWTYAHGLDAIKGSVGGPK